MNAIRVRALACLVLMVITFAAAHAWTAIREQHEQPVSTNAQPIEDGPRGA